MHEVLQRTRPAPAPAAPPRSKLFRLLRSWFRGERGLILFAVVGGATLGSQSLMGLLRPAAQPAPGRPTGSEGRQQSASKLPPPSPPSALRADPGATLPPPTRDQGVQSRSTLDAASGANLPPPAPSLSALRASAPDALPALPVARRSARPSPALRHSWSSDQGEAAVQGVISYTRSDVPSPASSAAPVSLPTASGDPAVLSRQEGVPQLDPVSLPDLHASRGEPCNETAVALPADGVSEDASPPGSDASPWQTLTAQDTLPHTSIDTDAIDPATSPVPSTLQAHRNTPCLPKQPAGQN